MISIRSYFFALAVALGLSACGGGGGGGGEALPSADYTLPAEYTATGPGAGGIEDHLASGTGTWRVNLDGQTQTTYTGTATLYNALVYDNVADKWIFNVNGANHTLDYWVDNNYDNWTSCSTCLDFYIYDDDNNPATSQYGTFGTVFYDTPTIPFGAIFMHAGLKTPTMPTSGSGTYGGTFEGGVIGDLVLDELVGTATVTADFGTGGTTFSSDGSGSFGGSYSLGGTGTITGNTYQGTVSGSYDDGAGTVVNFVTAGSTLSGAFYGPDQTTVGVSETAGVVYSSDAAGTNEIVGGFWAVQTGP